MSSPATERVPEALFDRLCFIDIETTGLDPSRDEIVEIGAVFVERGAITARRQWLVKPLQPIPPFITALTGLSDDEVASASSLSHLAKTLKDALTGWTLVAHNASFERAFLGECIAQNSMLDSCELAQLLFPERPSHSLDALLRWLQVGRAARHRALDDAEDTFFVMTALCERVLNEPNRDRLDQLIFHLEEPGATPSPLCSLLNSLGSIPPLRQRVPEISVPVPLSEQGHLWAGRIAQWLEAPAFVPAEIERAEIVSIALEAGRLASERLRKRIAIAMCASSVRELEETDPGKTLARRPVCITALTAALAAKGNTENERLARAYLSSWLSRTHSGDLDSLSHSFKSRCPEVNRFIFQISPLPCNSAACFAHRGHQSEQCVVVTHEHALEWLEYGLKIPLVFLEAERLPEAERRRCQRSFELSHLENFPALETQIAEVRTALSTIAPGVVMLRSRLSHRWLALREAMTTLAHALRAEPLSEERADLLERIVEVLAPPPAGFEVVVNAAGLVRVPTRPAERVARRLKTGHCLVSSFHGGLKWTGAATIGAPTPHPGWLLEWRSQPTSLERLAQLVAEAGPLVLSTSSPLGPIVEACRNKGLSVSLGANQDAFVHLCQWRRNRPLPKSGTCVLYDVREWRRAVLASNASRVVLLSAQGLSGEPIEQALRGLEPRRLPN